MDSYETRQHPLNEKHAADPQVGDLWHEMFCVQYAVVGRLPGHVVVLHDVIHSREGQTFDLTKPKILSLAAFRAAQRYAHIDGWVNDVLPKRAKAVADAFHAQQEVA